VTPAAGKIRFDQDGDVWFFAYGSLMWDPSFPHAEVRRALLRGYHRAFCVDSLIYRGTPEKPGLTLGLDRGGSCLGLAFRVAAGERDAVAAYLEDRELREDIYFCRRVPVTTPEGRIDAHAFVVNRNDPIYAGKPPLEETVRRIATCRGERGPNVDYLRNTVAHLDALGIGDGPLQELLRRVDAFALDGRLP
jgi:cation transport protein ChaC